MCTYKIKTNSECLIGPFYTETSLKCINIYELQELRLFCLGQLTYLLSKTFFIYRYIILLASMLVYPLKVIPGMHRSHLCSFLILIHIIDVFLYLALIKTTEEKSFQPVNVLHVSVIQIECI